MSWDSRTVDLIWMWPRNGLTGPDPQFSVQFGSHTICIFDLYVTFHFRFSCRPTFYCCSIFQVNIRKQKQKQKAENRKSKESNIPKIPNWGNRRHIHQLFSHTRPTIIMMIIILILILILIPLPISISIPIPILNLIIIIFTSLVTHRDIRLYAFFAITPTEREKIERKRRT